jgi:hypothetical protein
MGRQQAGAARTWLLTTRVLGWALMARPLRNHLQQRRDVSGVLLMAPLADNRFAVQYRDGRTEIIDAALSVFVLRCT